MFVISVFRDCLVTHVDNRSMKILYLGTQTIQYTFYQIYDIIDLSNRKQNKKLEKSFRVSRALYVARYLEIVVDI